jgi:hypothetical protein
MDRDPCSGAAAFLARDTAGLIADELRIATMSFELRAN